MSLPDGVTWCTASICPKCCRVAKHKPYGMAYRFHGCRLRWIARRVAIARFDGWDEGYRFALENISDPMVVADLNAFGTGWAGLVMTDGIVIRADDARAEGAQEGQS